MTDRIKLSDDRMSAIQGLMADRASEYWRGPKADALQQEYLDLIEVRNRSKARGAGFEMEEQHRVPVGQAGLCSDGEAFKGSASWPEPDDKAAANRMAELQTLMAVQHFRLLEGSQSGCVAAGISRSDRAARPREATRRKAFRQRHRISRWIVAPFLF